MNICFVSETADPSNGSGRFAYSMVTRLVQDRQVQATTLVPRGEPVTHASVKAVLFKDNVRRFLLNPLIIAWYGRHADLIHAFDGWPCMIMAYLATRLSRKPYTVSLYGTYAVLPLLEWKKKWLMKAAYRHCALNAAISRCTADRIRRFFPSVHVEVINQGISFAMYEQVRPAILPDETQYILTVATMKSRKGFHVAIPAFARVHNKHPELKYVIVAKRKEGNIYLQSILKLVEDHHLQQAILWKEGLSEEELISLYQHARVFFLPSVSLKDPAYFEGFGSVYLEAQSCGTPVVTSRGGGQEDAMIDGETGYLIDEENVDQAEAALERLVEDPALRARMSSSARAFAQRMDWSHVLDSYYERFERILAR